MDLESVSAVRLKRGLSAIKKDLQKGLGAVWKLKKPQVVNKLKKLKYKYDDKEKALLPIYPHGKKRRLLTEVKI